MTRYPSEYELSLEPHPSDGPEFFTEWAFWALGLRKKHVWVCDLKCSYPMEPHTKFCRSANWPMAHEALEGKTIHERKRNMMENDQGLGPGGGGGYTLGPEESLDVKRENPHNPIQFLVTIKVTAAELAELEKTYHPVKVEVEGAEKPYFHPHPTTIGGTLVRGAEGVTYNQPGNTNEDGTRDNGPYTRGSQVP